MRAKNRSWRREPAERESDRLLASYRSLDVLATAVFQVGIAAAALGATIGLTSEFEHHYLVAIWGVFPLCAGFFALLEMIEVIPTHPTRARLEKKRRAVNNAAISLMLSLFAGATAIIIAGAFIKETDHRMMPRTNQNPIPISRQATTNAHVPSALLDAPASRSPPTTARSVHVGNATITNNAFVGGRTARSRSRSLCTIDLPARTTC